MSESTKIWLWAALGLTGAPSYVVGDQILGGAVGFDTLQKAVAEVRAAKRANH